MNAKGFRATALLVVAFFFSVAFADFEEFFDPDGNIIVRESIQLDEFAPPTPVQSAEFTLYKLNEVNDAIAGMAPQSDCPGPKVPVQRGGETKSVAVCMLSDDEFEKYQKDAKKKKYTLEFSVGNDADPRLAGVHVSADGQTVQGLKPGQKTNDDVGRTFDYKARGLVEDDSGYTGARFESTSFGQQPYPGAKSSTGKPLMKLLTVSSLTVESGDKLPGEDLGVSDYFVKEGSIEVSDGRAKTLLGTQLQTMFHKKTQSGPIYDYVENDKVRVRGLLKTGFSRLIEGDIGAFHCRFGATGLVGIGTDGKPIAEARIGASVNTGTLGGRTGANPWIELDGYRKHLVRPGGRPEEETGIRISTSVEIAGVTVKPFIGVTKYDGPLDRKYAKGSSGGYNEPFYSAGIVVKWK